MTDPRCPRCQAPPPALATCDACEEGYAPFVTAGACPRCALVWDRLECAACEGWTRLELWVADDGERRAFLERLLGPRGVDWEQVLTTTSRAFGADMSALFAREGEPTEDEERADARAEVLDAEDAVAQARRGEAELAALAPEAAASALGPELEAARRASKAAVDAALRALDEARQRAEALNRRALDATRMDPVEPPPPVEVTAGGPHAARCPSCGWQPDGYPRWSCSRTGCETRFDSFATGARCPACARTFATTSCCACRALAPAEAWWRAGGGAPPPPPTSADRPKEPATAGWLASKLAGLLDRGDATQDQVAASLERAADVTDRTLGRVMSFAASLGDDGVGAARLRASDWQGAVDECTRALQRRPDHAHALANRGYAHRRLGDDAAALRDLTAALASEENLKPEERARTLHARAALRYELSDHEGVVADATQAIALQGDMAEAYWYRSMSRTLLGELEAALADADEAVRRAPDPAGPLAWRAALQYERHAWPEVEADASAALERGAGVGSLLHRAIARLRLGRPAEALADARRALRLDPGQPLALVVRASARAGDDAAAALVDLRRLRRRDPWGERSRGGHWLAIEAHLAGEPERARRLLRDARDHGARPEYGALWATLLLDADDAWPAARDDWPGALARFTRGELDLEALLALAASIDDPQRSVAEREAEALCAAAALAERAERHDDAARLFRACVDAGGGWGVEHLWAALRLAGVTPRPPRPAPAPRTPAPSASLTDQLERLARLREQGVLDDEEFALAKRRLLQR